jgi:2-polyprenyl-3-methyl-5-hydroxy-6-metoxy-1,4-benzoquinol methylase
MRGLREAPEITPPPAAKVICPMCGSGSHYMEHALTRGEIHRCGQCGFVFACGTLEEFSDKGYYEPLGGYERFLAAKRPQWKALLRDLARRTQSRRLLEVGCARGYALALARQMGWLPYGVEICSDDVEFARSRFGLNIHHGPVETCPFEENAFAAIIMWSVIEHLATPRSALRACHRLLKPSGILSIHTCNVDSTVARSTGPQWSMFNLHGHLSFFSPATLTEALHRTGFEVVEIKTGIGCRPVDIDPKLRARLSLRKALARTALTLGVKEPIREALCRIAPGMRERGEFMSAIARKK